MKKTKNASYRHGNAKLTATQVLSLRADAAAGASFRELADKYQINRASAHAIVKRRCWRHI